MPFTVITDYALLDWLLQMKATHPWLIRWYLALQPYAFTVKHRCGKDHANTDFFSRQMVCEFLDERAHLGGGMSCLHLRGMQFPMVASPSPASTTKEACPPPPLGVDALQRRPGLGTHDNLLLIQVLGTCGGVPMVGDVFSRLPGNAHGRQNSLP